MTIRSLIYGLILPFLGGLICSLIYMDDHPSTVEAINWDNIFLAFVGCGMFIDGLIHFYRQKPKNRKGMICTTLVFACSTLLFVGGRYLISIGVVTITLV